MNVPVMWLAVIAVIVMLPEPPVGPAIHPALFELPTIKLEFVGVTSPTAYDPGRRPPPLSFDAPMTTA